MRASGNINRTTADQSIWSREKDGIHTSSSCPSTVTFVLSQLSVVESSIHQLLPGLFLAEELGASNPWIAWTTAPSHLLMALKLLQQDDTAAHDGEHVVETLTICT